MLDKIHRQSRMLAHVSGISFFVNGDTKQNKKRSAYILVYEHFAPSSGHITQQHIILPV